MIKVLLFAFLLLAGLMSIGQPKNCLAISDSAYVDLGSDVLTDVRTIEFWFSLNEGIGPNIQEVSTILARNTDNCQSCNEVTISFDKNNQVAPGQLHARVFDSSGNGVPFSSISNQNMWEADRWYHYAMVLDSNVGLMTFVDGVLQNDIDQSGTNAILANNYPVAIGRWGSVNFRFFDGKIDDLRFSTSARYNSNFTPPCPNITLDQSSKALWYFNDSNLVSIQDESTGQYNGTIYGAMIPRKFVINYRMTQFRMTQFRMIRLWMIP
jgi:hypothetical protein